MGTFAETAFVDYRVSFADQGKQTSVSVGSKQTEVCRFRFPFAANKQKLPSVCGIPETWRHGIQISNRKQKLRRFSLIHLPFAHCANVSLSFVRLLTNKQTEVIHLKTD
jgi:hypothetical protein